MSEHSIRQIAGGADGEEIYCACGTVIHNPPHDEFMSAYAQHVETQVREQVAREIETEGRAVAERYRASDLADGVWDGVGTSSPNEREWWQWSNTFARIARGGEES